MPLATTPIELYKRIFHNIHMSYFPEYEASAQLEKRFIDALITNEDFLKQKKYVDLNLILTYNLSIEAIEFYLRIRKIDSNLSAILKTYSFLIEVQKPFSNWFESTQTFWPIALVKILYSSFCSVLILIKGAWQTWRYRLV